MLNEPEIRFVTIDRETDDFIVLASDGLFDKFSSKDCIASARQKFLTMGITEQDPFVVATHLVQDAIFQRINSDNTTVVVVCLNSGLEQK